MNIYSAGMQIQPFQVNRGATVCVPTQSQSAAQKVLDSVLKDVRGIGMLYGPESSGKTTVCQQFVRNLDAGIAVAVVDARSLNAITLLSNILSRFGYEIEFDSSSNLLNMVRVFAVQQTRSKQAPIIIVENLDRSLPSALRVICNLARLKVRHRFALRFILVSTRPSYSILHSSATNAISKRLVDVSELEAMSCRETTHYLHSKLRAGGVKQPDSVFPQATCDTLHAASGGWPGILNELAASAIERAEKLPVCCDSIRVPATLFPAEEIPKLFVTLNGKTVDEFGMEESKVLIGRSEFCDVCIADRYTSNYHALLIRSGNGSRIVDLNSQNGTFVNSRRVFSRVLRHRDVISLGSHRIKFVDDRCRAEPARSEDSLEDTAAMKTVEEARRTVAHRPFARPGMGKRNGLTK